MSLKDVFFAKIDAEHDEFVKKIEGLSTEEIVNDLWNLARFQTVYNYIKEWKPELEDSQYEHLLKMERPLETICGVHARMPSELHEDYSYAIGIVTDYELLSVDDIDTSEDEELYNDIHNVW